MGQLLLYFSMTLLLLPFSSAQSSDISIIDFHVGVILDQDSSVGRIGNCCLSMALSDFYSAHRDYKTRLVLHARDSNGSVVHAAAAALGLLQDVKVDAIIGPERSTQVNFVADLGDRARVPIISFSATSSSLFSRNKYFVQTAQNDAHQVQAIASIVKNFQWSQVVIIYEETELGNGILPYLCTALEDVDARVSYRSVLPKLASDEFIRKELYKMMTMQTRVFVVHMSETLATKLFLKVEELGMMSKGYVWIVTSGLTDLFHFQLDDDDVLEALQGVIGVRPVIPKSKELISFSNRWIRKFLQDNENIKPADTSIFGLWAYDTLWALAMAAERVGNNGTCEISNQTDAKSNGSFSMPISKRGSKLLKALMERRFMGLAGEFNLPNGQLEQTSYEIVNFVDKTERRVGKWTKSFSLENMKSIIWPGDSKVAPRGWEVPVSGKKLRIGVPQKPGFNEFLKVEIDPQTNATKVTGYYKEVFEAVMAALPYAIPYEFSPYPFFSPNDTRIGTYDDLVYQVSLQEQYDAALGDITITANRSIYSDFTLPYAEGGIASIVPIKYQDVNEIFTFFQPLTTELWLVTATFFISTSAAFWILASRVISRSENSPVQHDGSTRDSLGQHVGMIGYFPFFPGQTIEASLLSLILVTWGVVASLLISTYTASLSSILTEEALQPTFKDVTSQLIKHGDFVGCQEGSFLVSYLKKSGFDESKIKTYKSASECDEALTLGSKKGGISAYYDVLPHIKIILSQHCGKYTMGPVNRTDGFAFAFPKGSPFVADISRAIIQLTENGTIIEIEQRLPECSDSDFTRSSSSVTLRSFVVLFTFTGFVTLTCLVVSLLRRRSSSRQRTPNANANSRCRSRFLELIRSKQSNSSSHVIPTS